MFWFGVHLVIEDLFKQTHCVRYFTNIDLVCFVILPVNKVDTMCWAYMYRTCEYLCHDWYSIYWFLFHYIIKNLSSFYITWWGGLTSLLQYARTWKWFSFVKIHCLRCIYQKYNLCVCIFILNDLWTNIYCLCFLLINLKLKCLSIFMLFTREGVVFMFHEITSDSHIFSKFTCKSFMAMS